MKLTHILTTAALVTTLSANAQTAATSSSDQQAPQLSATAASQSEGEVRKVDKDQGKVTLRHGPLQNLDMPAMTMVFKAADPKLLEGLKEGDKVRFTAQRVNGVIAVTSIEAAK